jgi:adenine-specific DNA-methyltransferase
MISTKNPKLQELVTKLREIFQIDRPELDFGIYRILSASAGEINDYLQNRLPEKVQQALSAGSAASAQQLQAELQEAEKNAQALGVSPDAVPKVQELRANLKETAAGSSEHENAVFSHLLAFFSRYYEQGDFISQRRYKGNTYAIPYAGEEVMLHWANKDQYYTKSGENFSNYSFKLPEENGKPGRTVHFRLVAADTAKDNRKDNDKERRFALLVAKTVTRLDENGDEYEEELVPVEEVSGSDGNQELIIRFEYAAQPKGTKQEALVTKAVEAVLADAAVKAHWLALGNRAPTEKSPQRTLIEKHLSDYTTKNTADYFIHKDLGGFLRRELDFYIKNEVMHLDDVQNAGAFANIERNLRMIQCLRSIALELITFLAQLEDFQKKLWLKKKFVVSSHYCITLDRVPEALWPEVAANERQWEYWRNLGMLDDEKSDLLGLVKIGSLEYLKTRKFLMIDTTLFGTEFKYRLLAALDNLDENLDGLLVNGDNFQGLNLLQEGYRNKVNSIYIDPPYNTSASEILYKNSYKHSSWLSLMQDRVIKSKSLLTHDGNLCVTIDDVEVNELLFLLKMIFGVENIEGIVPIRINPSGRPTERGFALTHEYALFFGNSDASSIAKIPRTEAQLTRFSESDEIGRFEWRNLRREGSNSDRADGERQFFPIYVDLNLGTIRVPEMRWEEDRRSWVEEDAPKANESIIFPVNDQGKEKNWRWSEESIRRDYSQFLARTPRGGTPQVYYKYRENTEGTTPLTLWTESKFSATEYGTKILKDLFGDSLFSYPKSIHAVEECLSVMGTKNVKNSVVLDYFAGSGTTAHAVISLNRAGGKHKYVLVEQGEYFDLVTKPRVQKVVYSADWKDGKPIAKETGVSHAFKVIKIESYEDTLNNLRLCRTSAQDDLLNALPQQAKDDYLINYLLELESRGSLLSVEKFKKPFDFTLNIAVDSAGASEPRKVDLVETFNYLIGLRVKHIDAQPQRGFVTVTGTLPSNETCLVLWRDCDVLDYEGINKLCDKLAINPADNEFDLVYINGDHNIPTVLTQTAEEGGATRVLKLRQIEPEFLERMFSVEDI